jgi:hypothetical protein
VPAIYCRNERLFAVAVVVDVVVAVVVVVVVVNVVVVYHREENSWHVMDNCHSFEEILGTFECSKF